MDSRTRAWRLAVKAAQKLGQDTSKARPHELVLLAALSTSENTYNLELSQDLQPATVAAIANGLLDRDAFMASEMALGILQVPVISSVEYPSAGKLAYFPDPNVWSTAAGTAILSESQALESVYFGTHSLQTNEGLRIEKNPNMFFRTVQQTQGSATTQNMQTGLEMKDIGAVVRFAGGDENKIIIRINCADKTHLNGPAGWNNYLYCRLGGAIIKGSTTKTYVG